LPVEAVEADLAVVAVEDLGFEPVDALLPVELAVDASPFVGAGDVAQDEVGPDQWP
jgi:hypothetical protein